MAPTILSKIMKHTEITSIKQLANYLRCNLDFLEKAISEEYLIIDGNFEEIKAFIGITVEKLYIKKKGKASGFRVVHSIFSDQLSNTLKILNTNLRDLFSPQKCVHGYVNGRHIKTNASIHLSKKLILSVDIQDFFENITQEMISIALQRLGFQKNVAQWLAKITTIEGRLVQGFNTSPTIANIVVDDMDKKLMELCGSNVDYTRYADDLYFSTNETLPDKIEIRKIIEGFGFKLNEAKTKLMKRGQSQFVTGLTVFDNQYPRIPKRVKRNLRLEIHYISKFGYAKHSIRRLKDQGIFQNNPTFRQELAKEKDKTRLRLFGWLHYIHSIEPKLSNKLYKKLFGA